MAKPPLTLHPAWPFAVALVAAIAFGFVGARLGQHWLSWAVGGGGIALVISGLASGLANAVALPYTRSVIRVDQLVALVVSVAIVLLIGWLLVFLRRQLT